MSVEIDDREVDDSRIPKGRSETKSESEMNTTRGERIASRTPAKDLGRGRDLLDNQPKVLQRVVHVVRNSG